jgi:colanic acid biosynthesis glycosyl transferase WcaI
LKLLFINQYYWPDYAATAQVLTDLAEALAARGDEVHVLCSRGKYDDGSGVPRSLLRHEERRGVHIHRLTATGFGKRTKLGRVLDYLSFHLLIGLRILLTGWRYDGLITLTTPPLVGLYATPVKWLARRRHICWVMDLHPDCEFELGMVRRSNPLARLADWLNGLHFRHADRCVVLGDYMARRLRDKRVPAERITAIPIWGHAASGLPDDAQPNPLRRQWGLEGKFVVMYSGNAGLIHTFDAICQAALRLRDQERIVFLFVGGGRRIAEIQAFGQRHALANIRIMPYVPREHLGQSLALGDVHLISLREGMAGVAVPSKLYGIMAAGRPAVFVGPQACETADAIRAAPCGRTVGAADADGLAAALTELADNPDLRRRYGAGARAAYQEHYRPEVCVRQWCDLVDEVGGRRARNQS